MARMRLSSAKYSHIVEWFPKFQILAGKYPHLTEKVTIRKRAKDGPRVRFLRSRSGVDFLDWQLFHRILYIENMDAENHKGTGPLFLLHLFTYLKINEKNLLKHEFAPKKIIIDAVTRPGFEFYRKILGFVTINKMLDYFQKNGEYIPSFSRLSLSFNLFFDLLTEEWKTEAPKES